MSEEWDGFCLGLRQPASGETQSSRFKAEVFKLVRCLLRPNSRKRNNCRDYHSWPTAKKLKGVNENGNSKSRYPHHFTRLSRSGVIRNDVGMGKSEDKGRNAFGDISLTPGLLKYTPNRGLE